MPEILDFHKEQDADKLLSAFAALGVDWSLDSVIGSTARLSSEPLVDQRGNLFHVMEGLHNRTAPDAAHFDIGKNEKGQMVLVAHFKARCGEEELQQLQEHLHSLSGNMAMMGVVSADMHKWRQEKERHKQMQYDSEIVMESQSYRNADIHMLRRMLEDTTNQKFHLRGDTLHGPTAYFENRKKAETYARQMKKLLHLPSQDALKVNTGAREHSCGFTLNVAPQECPAIAYAIAENHCEINDLAEQARYFPAVIKLHDTGFSAKESKTSGYRAQAAARKNPSPDRGV